ncbi:unnamed protein product [Lactuca virosa]|uniref:Uncharacterized protein n=1 Tax=Lactuca virosa TaxID=75947 RepID=A0AAU9LG22_9ASTR|nr:unnamed protein product [Lactuca virosa]
MVEAVTAVFPVRVSFRQRGSLAELEMTRFRSRLLQTPSYIKPQKLTNSSQKKLITTTMCYKVECKKCGLTGWGGCGEHLRPLYASIDTGKHCMCRSWPGVVIPSSGKPSASTTKTTTTTTTAAG